MPFIVHSPGAQSLLVDFGRPRSRELGVPVGGAADRTAMTLGNALVGNDPQTVALEMGMVGPTLEATGRHACVVFGAAFSIWVNERRSLPVGRTFVAEPGDIITIGAAEAGLRGYLCVHGGIESKSILGSRSALEPIQEGQTLVCPESSMRTRSARPTLDRESGVGSQKSQRPPDPRLLTPDSRVGLTELRIFPAAEAAENWAAQEYTISPHSNRMGVRLIGKTLRTAGDERPSAPVCPGTVQITHDGQAIILGVDAQTIGGYPRIAHVIMADIDKLAQVRPNERIRFRCVSLGEAEEAWRAKQRWLKEWTVRLQNSLV